MRRSIRNFVPEGYTQLEGTQLYYSRKMGGVYVGSLSVGSIDLIGKFGDTYYSSTYGDYGYVVALRVDDNAASFADCLNGSIHNGVSFQADIEPQGEMARMYYTLTNTNDYDVHVSLGAYDDVYVGDNIAASITRKVDTQGNTYGISLADGGGAQLCVLFGAGLAGVTGVDDFWFGSYSINATANAVACNYSSGSNYMVENGNYDCGIGWGWKNRLIMAGQTVVYSYLIAIGDVNLEPNSNFEVTPDDPDGWNDLSRLHVLTLQGNYESPAGLNGKIEYAVENSEEWTALTEMLESGSSFTGEVRAMFDPTLSNHTIKFRTVDQVGNTTLLPSIVYPDVAFYSVSGIENMTFTGDSLFQTNLTCSLEEGYYALKNYQNNVNVGTASFNFEGVFPHTIGRKTYTFDILQAPLMGEIALSGNSIVYNGNPIIPEWSFTEANYASLKIDKDYTVEYLNNIMPGTATITVTGIGNYTGTLTKSFQIEKAPLAENQYKITLPEQTIGYDETGHGASIVVPEGAGVVTITYQKDGVSQTEPPIEPGVYDIYLEIAEGTLYQGIAKQKIGSFTIKSQPNLHVTEISNSDPVGGTVMTVKWKVRNDGHASTGDTEWKDRVWIVPEIQGGTSMRDAQLLTTVNNVSALNVGEFYENTANIQLPERVYGNYDLLVTSDMASANDIDFSKTDDVPPYPYEPDTAEYGYLKAKTSGNVLDEEGVSGYSDNFFYKRIEIAVPPLPDIVVTSVAAVVDNSADNGPSPLSMAGLAGSTAFYSGKYVKLTATIENKGGEKVPKNPFNSTVYISHSEDYESEDLLAMTSTITETELAQDEKTTIEFSFQIPYDWSGETYFHVHADTEDVIYELASITNNWGHSSKLNVLLTPGADFEVSQVEVPSTISAGIPFNVSYQVRNIGAGAPYVNKWTDKIYISQSADGLDDSAICIGTFNQEGDYVLNADGSVSKYQGDDYSPTRTVTAKGINSGTYYIYVVADGDYQITEYDGEDNNVMVSSAVSCIVPDLTAELISISESTLMLGGTTIVTWKLKNSGPADIRNAEITDEFFASTAIESNMPFSIGKSKNTISIASGSETTLRTVIRIPNDNSLLGEKVIFLETNVYKSVDEDLRDNNKSNGITTMIDPCANLAFTDTSLPDAVFLGKKTKVSFYISNVSSQPISGNASFTASVLTGTYGETPTACTVEGTLPTINGLQPGKSVYAEMYITVPNSVGGGQKFLSMQLNPDVVAGDGAKSGKEQIAVFIIGNQPDLLIETYSVPDTIPAATPTDISWTITNEGDWDGSKYIVNVYVSKQETVDKNAQGLYYEMKSSLMKGKSKTFKKTVTIDDNHTGEMYLIINISGVKDESNTANNNIAIPIVVTPTEQPDLAISDLTVDGKLRNGEMATVTAKVMNAGKGYTRSEKWADVFYLSPDIIFNPAVAINIGSKAHVGHLQPDGSYKITTSLKMPLDAHGDYYLHAFTDAKEANPDSDKSNNSTCIKVYVEDKTDYPAQLAVESVDVPTQITAGKSFTLSYAIKNSGTFPADGTLRDVIYLSKDNQWENNDQMVGVVTGEFNLAAGDKSVRQTTGRITNVTEGSYYLIVKTNSTRNIFESSYEDNYGISVQPVNIHYADISVGGTASCETSGYYKLDVSGTTEGKTLGFYLSHNEDDACGLYIAYESVPSTAKYEWASTTLQTAEQEVLVPNVKTGTYYILAQANTAANLNLNQFSLIGEDAPDEVAMTLSARDIPFGATSLSVNEGGTEGWITTEIHGALLDSIMDFRLATDQMVIPTEALTFHNQTHTVATFNLNKAEVGTYDVISELPNGTQATLPDGFKVIPGLSVNLGVKLGLPAAARTYFFAPVSIAYANGGNTDIAIKELLVIADGGVLGETVDELEKGKTELHIVPDLGQDKRGYVSIPPGTQKVINCFIGTSGGCNVTVYVVK